MEIPITTKKLLIFVVVIKVNHMKCTNRKKIYIVIKWNIGDSDNTKKTFILSKKIMASFVTVLQTIVTSIDLSLLFLGEHASYANF